MSTQPNSKEEIFRGFRHLGMTPQRLLENYITRNGLSKEDEKYINLIIEYAEANARKELTDLYGAMKEGVAVRIADLEQKLMESNRLTESILKGGN